MPHLTLTDQNYKQLISTSQIPVIIDFWAPWCPPCKLLDPIFDELGNEYEGKIVVGKINADENPQAVSELSVMSMPTIVFFKGGQPVKAVVGAYGKETYKQTIEEILGNNA